MLESASLIAILTSGVPLLRHIFTQVQIRAIYLQQEGISDQVTMSDQAHLSLSSYTSIAKQLSFHYNSDECPGYLRFSPILNGCLCIREHPEVQVDTRIFSSIRTNVSILLVISFLLSLRG